MTDETPFSIVHMGQLKCARTIHEKSVERQARCLLACFIQRPDAGKK
jgi:hypothetical protein